MSFYNNALVNVIKSLMKQTDGSLFRAKDFTSRLFDKETNAYDRAINYLKKSSQENSAFPQIKEWTPIEKVELLDRISPIFNRNDTNKLYNPINDIINDIEYKKLYTNSQTDYENALIKAINDRTPESPRIGNIEQLFSGQNNKLVDEFSNNFDNIVRNNSFSDDIIDPKGNKINFDVLNMNDKNIQYFDKDDLQNILQENTDILDNIAEPSLMKIIEEKFRRLEGY